MMAVHKIKEYKDGYKIIPYCEVCGFDNPVDECSGVWNEKAIDKDDKLSKIDKGNDPK